MKEPWAVFYLGDKELAAYTLRGTFSGSGEAPAERVAYETGVPFVPIGLFYHGR